LLLPQFRVGFNVDARGVTFKVKAQKQISRISKGSTDLEVLAVRGSDVIARLWSEHKLDSSERERREAQQAAGSQLFNNGTRR
jgi:hypothetical protein